MKDVNILVNGGVNIKESFELFGDMEIYNETLEDFLQAVDEKLDKIKRFKEAGDMANYAILVHSLKSDSKYLGFTRLAEISYQHELQSKANDTVYVYENYDELITEAKRIINVVRAYFGKEPVGDTTSGTTGATPDKKLLVVDDSDLIRTLIHKIFHNEYEILTARDGQEALNVIASRGKELYGMLLDLNMPNVNGFAVLEYFQANGLFTKIPVAIITGEDTDENLLKVTSYPIVDVLRKPFNENNIRIVLNAMEQYHLD